MSKKLTLIVWLAMIAVVIVWDVVLFTDSIAGNTWSAVTTELAFRHPMVAVMTCVLPTHWFVPMFYGTKLRRWIMLGVAIAVAATGVVLDLTGNLPLWFFGLDARFGLILYCATGLGLGLLWPQPLPRSLRDGIRS